MLTLGIALGLACAFCHALSYISTRSFVTSSDPRELLAIGHIQMAAISVLLLPFLWIDPPGGWEPVILPLFGAAGFYLLAQTFLFITIRAIPASIVSPLLGLKLISTAVIGVLLFSDSLNPLQWVGISLTSIAAFCLFKAGEKIPTKSILTLMFTCLCYSLSDLNIGSLLKAIDPEKSIEAALFAVACEYTLSGLYGVFLYLRLPKVEAGLWKKAIPFTLTWYGAMCFLYAAIGILGVVLACILQSMRGLISIGLGTLIAHRGHHHLEQKVNLGTRLRQVGAALLMFAAVVLYILGKTAN